MVPYNKYYGYCEEQCLKKSACKLEPIQQFSMNLVVTTSIQSVMVCPLLNLKSGVMKMKVPNWQHHSKKEAKRKLKPQALRSARERRRHLINSLLNPSKRRVSSYYGFIPNQTHGSSTRSQVTISTVACY